MKGTLYSHAGKAQIVLKNGVIFNMTENEEIEEFSKRVEDVIARDYVDSLDLVEKTIDDYKGKRTKTMKKEYDELPEDSIERLIMQEVLDGRGVELENMQSPNVKKVGPHTIYEAPDEEPDQPLPEASDEEDEGEKKPKKAKKAKEPKKSLVEVEAEAKEAEKIVGHEIEFTPFRATEPETGIVSGVIIDKRVNYAYFRIKVDGKYKHIKIDSDYKDLGVPDQVEDTENEDLGVPDQDENVSIEDFGNEDESLD